MKWYKYLIAVVLGSIILTIFTLTNPLGLGNFIAFPAVKLCEYSGHTGMWDFTCLPWYLLYLFVLGSIIMILIFRKWWD